jgi:hypothetical protein
MLTVFDVAPVRSRNPQEIDDAEFERLQKEMVERAAKDKKRPAAAASAGGKASAPKRKKK